MMWNIRFHLDCPTQLIQSKQCKKKRASVNRSILVYLRKKKADLMLNMGSKFCSSNSFLSSTSQVENSLIAWWWNAITLIARCCWFSDLGKPGEFLDCKRVSPKHQLVVHRFEGDRFLVHLIENLSEDQDNAQRGDKRPP